MQDTNKIFTDKFTAQK